MPHVKDPPPFLPAVWKGIIDRQLHQNQLFKTRAGPPKPHSQTKADLPNQHFKPSTKGVPNPDLDPGTFRSHTGDMKTPTTAPQMPLAAWAKPASPLGEALARWAAAATSTSLRNSPAWRETFEPRRGEDTL